MDKIEETEQSIMGAIKIWHMPILPELKELGVAYLVADTEYINAYNGCEFYQRCEFDYGANEKKIAHYQIEALLDKFHNVPDVNDEDRYDNNDLYKGGYRWDVIHSPTEEFKTFMLAEGYIGYSLEAENTYTLYVLDESLITIISTPIANVN